MENGNATSDLNKNEIYGSFFLNESEFCISTKYVQEVVNSPPQFTSLPLSPPYLKGLFNLRGSVIPVVDLRIMLNLPTSQEIDEQKIAVIEMGTLCLGLLFNRTGEVFRSLEDERSDFQEGPNQIVSGVFKKELGKRIVQILNIEGLFKIEYLSQTMQGKENSTRKKQLGNRRGTRKQCISFTVGPSKCAVGIDGIQEIIKIDKVDESALSTGSCLGAIDLRGATIPVVDFAALLKYRDADRSNNGSKGERRVVVTKIEEEFFGLMVDSVDNIISYYPDELVHFQTIQNDKSEMFVGCISREGSPDILLLNQQKVLSDSEIIEITHGHSKLYQASNAKNNEDKKKHGVRNTYITFSLENAYAIGIGDVKEIIDYPQTLLQPPGLPSHFQGVLNLRGELVTIVDARTMYAAAPSRNISKGKVLVFKRNGLHFGLVVDSVEAIISVLESDKIKLPQVFYQDEHNGLSEDIGEAADVDAGNGQRKSLLILSVDAIAARVGKFLSAS